MFGLNSRTPLRTCGVVIDIGSGSVGAAIVISDSSEDTPTILWSHREYTLIKDIDDTEVSLKEVSTALINAFLQLGSQGMAALKNDDSNLHITSIQTTISAPWTYTVTKTINFSDKHPFEVDAKLMEQLSLTAEKQAFTAVLENKIFDENQLEIIDNKTIGTTINGYPIKNPNDIKTREMSLAHVTAITQKKILSVLEDSLSKILPKATQSTHSFMYLYYDVLKHMKPDTAEACIIDVTSEATEIGIIREGVLTHVTHIAFGTFSIAREIATLCGIPKEEAYMYLKGGTSFVETKLSDAKKAELLVIIEAYEEKIANLFRTTGDALAIPKTLFLHCNTLTEDFFVTHIEKAAMKATTMQHSVHPITPMLFKKPTSDDTALLLSAYYYHRMHKKNVLKDA